MSEKKEGISTPLPKVAIPTTSPLIPQLKETLEFDLVGKSVKKQPSAEVDTGNIVTGTRTRRRVNHGAVVSHLSVDNDRDYLSHLSVKSDQGDLQANVQILLA